MREPDDIPTGNEVNFYHRSNDLARDIGIGGAWETFFSPLFQQMERDGVPFNRRVRMATEQTNRHFALPVNLGINEHDYV